MDTDILIFVPCKPLPNCKSRLSSRLTAKDRGIVVRQLLCRTLRVIRSCVTSERFMLVSADCNALEIARSMNVQGLFDETTDDLNAVIRRMLSLAADRHIARIAYIPIDLPMLEPADIYAMLSGSRDAVTLVPDYANEGTNGLVIPVASHFEPMLGTRSFQRHVQQAERMGIPLQCMRLSGMVQDIDTPSDFDAWLPHAPSSQW